MCPTVDIGLSLLSAEIPVLLSIAHDYAELGGFGVDTLAVPVHRPTFEDGFLAASATHTQNHFGNHHTLDRVLQHTRP